jgi:hypothetical protein
VYKEYMRITEKFIRNEFSRSLIGVKHHMEVLYKRYLTPKKLSGTIFHASLEEVNHTDVVYKLDKKMVVRDPLVSIVLIQLYKQLCLYSALILFAITG